MVSNHTNNRRSQVSTHALAGTTEGSAFMLHAHERQRDRYHRSTGVLVGEGIHKRRCNL